MKVKHMSTKIFLSSTQRDLLNERDKVEKTIVSFGQQFIGMEHFFSREETALATCLTEVDNSQLFILVVGHRYGFTDSNGISYTEREYLRAGQLGKPRYVYLLDDAAQNAMRDDDADEQLGQAKQQQLIRFRAGLANPNSGHTVSFFKTPSELAWQIAMTLAKILPSRLRSAHGLLPPPPPDYFVGRQESLINISALLREHGTMGVVGIRGLPGMGKTAVASMFAYSHIGDYPDGLLWVEIAGRDPTLVLRDLATVFGEDVTAFADISSRTSRLRSILSGKIALLIFDNVTKEDLNWVSRLRFRCATLITTRLETIAMVPPNAMVVLSALSPEEAYFLCKNLLGERADRDRGELTELCRTVEFLPLAINILLRRLYNDPNLSARELCSRMRNRMGAIKEVSREDDPNLNVRSSLDMTFDVLTDIEQRVFCALAVFAGPNCSSSIVGNMLGVGDDVANETLDRLVGHGIIERVGNRRFRVHALIFSYAHNSLVESNAVGLMFGQAVGAYSRFVLDYAQPDRWDELEAERENFFGILEWCYNENHDTQLFEIVRGLRRYLETRGYWDQSLLWLSRINERATSLGDLRTQANALLNIATIHSNRGNFNNAETEVTESLKLFQKLGNRAGEAAALSSLGSIETELGNFDIARDHLERSLAIRKEIGDDSEIADSLLAIGNLETDLGHYGQGTYFSRQALFLIDRNPDKGNRAATLHSLGRIELGKGNFLVANSLFEQTLVLVRELGSKRGILKTLQSLMAIRFYQANYSSARDYCVEAIDLARTLDDKHGIGMILQAMGMIQLRTGDYALAKGSFEEGLRLAQEVGSKHWTALNHYSLGLLYAIQDNRTEAIDFLKAAIGEWEDFATPDLPEILLARSLLFSVQSGVEPHAYLRA
jgi:tetratricopeptide (TPR) repeat protein